jgi:hypothetical protein
VGLNVALTVQLAPTPKVLPQVVVSEKSPAFAPKMAICHKFIVALPLLVNVIVCAALLVPTVWLAKVRLVGDGPPAVPTPVRIIDGGLPPALELMTIEDFRGPAAVGVKVTFSRQLPAGARGLGQLWLRPKSPLLPPEIPMLLIVKGAPPVLISDNEPGALLVPTSSGPNDKERGERVTTTTAPEVKFNISIAKSVQPDESSGPHAVMLNTTFVMFAAVWSCTPM